MRRCWRCVTGALGLALAAGGADAGAWPRERGEGFLALSQRHARGAAGSEVMLYGEYGRGGGWTLGVDAGLAHLGGRVGGYRALVFARRAIGGGEGARRMAVGLGLGGAGWRGGYEPVLRPSFHWGHGFGQAGIGRLRADGWAAVDVSAELRPSGAIFKADSTLGLRPRDGLMLIWQLQSAAAPGVGHTLHAAPSVAIRLRPDTHMTLGLRAGIAGSRERSVLFGTWLAFPGGARSR